VLVFATGFDVTRFLSTLRVCGRSGAPLSEVWENDNATAYQGTVVPDFPNLFILFGPNVQTGHGGSLIALVEAQMEWVISVLTQMRRRGVASVEVRGEVHEQYVAEIDGLHAGMVWTHPGMSTYYRNSRGRVVVPTPFRVVDVWHRTRTANLDEFYLEPSHAPASSADAPCAVN
jgi:4-hydroxyacetophenone monooxygenase